MLVKQTVSEGRGYKQLVVWFFFCFCTFSEGRSRKYSLKIVAFLLLFVRKTNFF